MCAAVCREASQRREGPHDDWKAAPKAFLSTEPRLAKAAPRAAAGQSKRRPELTKYCIASAKAKAETASTLKCSALLIKWIATLSERTPAPKAPEPQPRWIWLAFVFLWRLLLALRNSSAGAGFLTRSQPKARTWSVRRAIVSLCYAGKLAGERRGAGRDRE